MTKPSDPDLEPRLAEITAWLDAARERRTVMSQRRLARVVATGVPLDRVVAEAARRGLHLLVATDEEGDELLVVGVRPFRVLC